MKWEIEGTDQFADWFADLTEAEQDSVSDIVELIEDAGPNLGYPRSSDIRGSRHGQMRELRIQHKGRAIRVLYAFDPRRAAILLIGGGENGNDNWDNAFRSRRATLLCGRLKES